MKTNTALKHRSLKNVLDTLDALSPVTVLGNYKKERIENTREDFSILNHLLGIAAAILLFLSLTGCATTNVSNRRNSGTS